MRRFFVLLIVALLILGITSGCGTLSKSEESKQDEETVSVDLQQDEKTESEPTDSSSKDIEQPTNATDSTPTSDDWDSIYAPILSQYQAAVDNQFYQDILNGNSDNWDSIGADINFELLSASRNYPQFSVYYALMDVNQNGSLELIIGGADDSGIVTNYDIFCAQNGQPVHLFPEMQFGYRTNLRILSDGTLMVTWSDSAFESGYDFYRISSEGCLPELIESISIHSNMEDTTLHYYHDTEGVNEITEEAFQQILDSYQNMSNAEVPWVEISASA